MSKSFLDDCRRRQVPVRHFAIDVNMNAAEETLRQCAGTGLLEVVRGDMFTFLRADFQFDIIFCNPPYVPSSPINRASDIRASYAGGERGRDFIDIFLPETAKRLKPDGVMYLLLEKRNDIPEVLETAKTHCGFTAKLILDRKIRGEQLFVYRFTR